MAIKIENITHIYNKGLSYESVALDNVSFDIEDGEFVGIIGHTGSGKSTLIQHINGILKPDNGRILINGKDITEKGVKMSDIRKKVGLVFQYPEYQLFEETVAKDVSFGPRNLGLSEEEVDARVREALDLVGLSFDRYGERSPFELSGGQKRRVAIAGVLAMKPEVLILDEPTAGLDPRAHNEILDMLVEFHKREKCDIIFVSHNMADVAEIADKIIVLSNGRIALMGGPKEVFKNYNKLQEIGLTVPPANEFMNMLKEKGLSVADNILTVDEAETEILRIMHNVE